ncbi:MAG TPA: IS1634 family transposase [Candidatus Limnocylindrales bacterium]|nr:IS1634 family transposase [Candidatus Limnocylindrales bacterium]
MTQSTEIQIQNLDHLGLVAGIIDEIGIVEIINEEISIETGEIVTAGQVVKGILLNGLGFVSRALYLFPQFFEDKATEHLLGKGIEAKHLNDDKIGRVMDKLYQMGLSGIFLLISLAAVKKFGVSTEDCHLDSTSVSVEGEYKKEYPTVEILKTGAEGEEIEKGLEPIKITYGYSRDRRPDLKQFMIDLIVSGDGDVPLFLRTGDGNEADKAVFGQIIREFKNQVNFDSLMVGDSAMYTKENLKLMKEMRWLSRVPLSIKAAQELVDSTPEKELTASKIPGYFWQETSSNYGGIEQRWLLVESQDRKESDLKKLAKKLEREKKTTLEKIRQLSEREFENKASALAFIKGLSDSLKYHQLTEIQVNLIQSKAKKLKVKSKDEFLDKYYQVQGKLAVNLPAIERQKKRAGRFVLATNDLDKKRLISEDILKKYKGQQAAERGFSFLKDPLFFADSIFLKSPHRIEVMAMLMGLCLLVYTIGQRQLRLNLEQQETGLKNQLGKLTARPTLRWIFQCFQGIHLLRIQGNQQISNLTDERLNILRFFPKPCQQYYLLS